MLRARSLRLAAALAVVFLFALLAVDHAPAAARHRIRTGVYFSFGPYWAWPYPYPYYWAYPPPPYYVYPPPPAVVGAPPVYIERPAASPPPPAPEGTYWYYCESAGAYYPTAPACPEPWIRVPPRP